MKAKRNPKNTPMKILGEYSKKCTDMVFKVCASTKY